MYYLSTMLNEQTHGTMKNVERMQDLHQAARDQINEILNAVGRQDVSHYACFYLNDHGTYTASTIQSDHTLGHGFYIAFGECRTKEDVIDVIQREESHLDQLVENGLEQYAGI